MGNSQLFGSHQRHGLAAAARIWGSCHYSRCSVFVDMNGCTGHHARVEPKPAATPRPWFGPGSTPV